VHEVVAAVLPCYWIYWEVGKKLLEKGSPDLFYRRWIETYAAPEFGKLVEDVLCVADELAAPLGDAERQAMTRHFVTASRYEWMFWDMAWRLETWPIG
jgi:thiaminase/transcriptional activator TenA